MNSRNEHSVYREYLRRRRIVAGRFLDIVGTSRIDLAVANAEDIEKSQPGQLSIYGIMFEKPS